jgi:hypothetical protein
VLMNSSNFASNKRIIPLKAAGQVAMRCHVSYIMAAHGYLLDVGKSRPTADVWNCVYLNAMAVDAGTMITRAAPCRFLCGGATAR